VFGYGSLMWSPCFDYSQKALGRAHGYHRALCILSTRYRGTQRKPGLVMGLCRGGSCWGMAYRIDAPRLRRALARLWFREMPRRVYEPSLIAVRLASRWLIADFGMERVQLRADEQNIASRKVAENAGFTQEGILRSSRFNRRLNRRVDFVVYSLLRDEL